MTEANNVNKGEELIPFLRTLADSIEQETILPEQLKSISTFFMSYKFQEQGSLLWNHDTDPSLPQGSEVLY